MDRTLLVVISVFFVLPAYCQESEIRSFTGNGGSGRPAVLHGKSDDAIKSAKGYACAAASRKAISAGFTPIDGSENATAATRPVRVRRNGEIVVEHIVDSKAGNCTIQAYRIVNFGTQGESTVDLADEEFRRGIENTFLDALKSKFPKADLRTLKAIAAQVTKTGMGKGILKGLGKYSYAKRAMYIKNSVEKLDYVLLGITEPKLKDFEQILDYLANELGEAETSESSWSTSQMDSLWAKETASTQTKQDLYDKWDEAQVEKQKPEVARQTSQIHGELGKPITTKDLVGTKWTLFLNLKHSKNYKIFVILRSDGFLEYAGTTAPGRRRAPVENSWSLSGSDIRFVFESGYMKYKGKLNGSRIKSGTASISNGNSWTWTAKQDSD